MHAFILGSALPHTVICQKALAILLENLLSLLFDSFVHLPKVGQNIQMFPFVFTRVPFSLDGLELLCAQRMHY